MRKCDITLDFSDITSLQILAYKQNQAEGNSLYLQKTA